MGGNGGLAEAWLRGLGAPKVMLMIREGNEDVRRFYERIGYAEEPRIVMSRWMEQGKDAHGG